MDVVECLESFNKMCDSYESCEDCELNAIRTSFTSCRELLTDNPKEILPIIEKWADNHPFKTRQDKFLEIFPNTKLYNETIQICPHEIGEITVCSSSSCDQCMADYWLEEVEA